MIIFGLCFISIGRYGSLTATLLQMKILVRLVVSVSTRALLEPAEGAKKLGITGNITLTDSLATSRSLTKMMSNGY